MTMQAHAIERLVPPANDADLRALAELLVDAVESGAAVGFLAPLTGFAFEPDGTRPHDAVVSYKTLRAGG